MTIQEVCDKCSLIRSNYRFIRIDDNDGYLTVIFVTHNNFEFSIDLLSE